MGRRRQLLHAVLVVLTIVYLYLQIHELDLFETETTETTTTTTATIRSSTSQHHDSHPHGRRRHHGRWAYVFLVAGCDPSKPWTYRNYLYNILVSAYVLKHQHNSQADIIVMVQLDKYVVNTTTSLPPRDERWLRQLNVSIRYLPKPVRNNFYSAQMEKFRILQLTEYARVMYLDADVLPLCNLDYLFEKSDPPPIPSTTAAVSVPVPTAVLQPNVILAWFREPAHGGLFLLAPREGDYERVQEIITRREAEAMELPDPHWDPIRGWGHVISKEDAWQGMRAWTAADTAGNNSSSNHSHFPFYTSTNWTFHGDFADQGLLYYWTKYVQKNVSIINLNHVEHWSSSSSSSAAALTVQVQDNILSNATCLPPNMEYPGHYGSSTSPFFHGQVPHRDFIHFTGSKKPWEAPMPKSLPQRLQDLDSSTDYWFYLLQKVERLLNVTIPRSKDGRLPQARRPTLGRYPTKKSMMNTIQTKLKLQRLREEEEKQPQ
jgi:lipopolysaccharide biosynthesis glycosyltransferase